MQIYSQKWMNHEKHEAHESFEGAKYEKIQQLSLSMRTFIE
jgi:hypothetical protein